MKEMLAKCECGGGIFAVNDKMAKCNSCEQEFDIQVESESTAPVPPPPPPPPPAKLNIPKKLELDKPAEVQLDAKKDDLPDYIKKSRPWRWAHEMKKTGNPYREDSKNYAVFQTVALHEPISVPAIVEKCSTLIGEKLSYLLTVYEVLSQCEAAGLIAVDAKGNYSVCKS